MIASLIHFGVACIVAYCIFYAVHYSEITDDEDQSDFNNTTKTLSDDSILDEPAFIVPDEELENTVIDNRFIVGAMIAVGHVGIVRNGIEQNTGIEVAIKFATPGENSEILTIEYENYLLLGAEEPEVVAFGIPNVLHFGIHAGYKVLVLKLLGPNLVELKEVTGKDKLFGKTILKIALQTMDTLKYIHSKGLIIYDIRAANMAVGNSKNTLNKIFIFDFASAIHISDEYLRTNDLMLFGLILMELNGVKFPNNINSERISDIFDSLVEKWDKDYAEELFIQSDEPEIFLEYFEYITLTSDENIDYELLKNIFAAGLTYADLDKKTLGIFDSS